MESENYERFMVVVAHPDDMEFSAAGTVAKMVKAGKTVILVQCTSGDKGTDRRDLTSPELAAMRESEELESCRRLGVADVVFLRVGDGEVMPDLEFREKIVRQIRTHQPDVIITHDPFRPYSLHPDHRAVGITAVDSAYPTARDPLYFNHQIQEGLEPHKTAELWLANPEVPDLYIDISATVEDKINALMAHQSQVGDGKGMQERIRQRVADVGAANGLTAAEAFKVIKMRR